jgi:hypothetical protein
MTIDVNPHYEAFDRMYYSKIKYDFIKKFMTYHTTAGLSELD